MIKHKSKNILGCNIYFISSKYSIDFITEVGPKEIFSFF